MNTVLTRDKIISKGSLVAVEVMGIPGKTGSDAVWTYEAHGDVEVGDMVRVPAPGWTVRVTGHDELPGFVLGLAASAPLDKRQIKTTIPLTTAAPEIASLAELREKVTQWRTEAELLRAAAVNIDGAADAVQRLIDRA